MEKPKYPIESVDSALQILLHLKSQTAIGVSEAAEFLGVAPSTAHRLFQMLQYRGFAKQDASTRTYRAGPELLEIGLKAVRDIDLRGRARPVIEGLRDRLNETVHLMMREGTDVRFIGGVESKKAVRVTSRVGMLLPAHATAAGKSLLAQLTPAQIRELYPSSRLPGVTDATIRRRSELEKELAEVRERGYAVNQGESEEDVSAVGAAIVDRQGRAHGALAIAVPSTNIDESRFEVLGEEVMKACEELGSEIE